MGNLLIFPSFPFGVFFLGILPWHKKLLDWLLLSRFLHLILVVNSNCRLFLPCDYFMKRTGDVLDSNPSQRRRTQTADPCALLSVPVDMQWLCASFLDASSLFSLAHTCSALRTLLVAEFPSIPDVFLCAASNGHVELMKWLLETIECTNEGRIKPLKAAAKNGHLDILKLFPLTTATNRMKRILPQAAAKRNHVNVLSWLKETDRFSEDLIFGTYSTAAQYGCLDSLIWLRGNFTHHNFEATLDPMFLAACSGHLATVQWLHGVMKSFHVQVLAAAASSGNLKLLKWLYTTDCPRSSDPSTSAAYGQHWHIVKWIYKKTGDIGSGRGIADFGNLEMMKWWRERGGVFTPKIATSAARSGNLELLKYVIEADCLVDPSDIWYAAAASGNIASLEFLREIECPWDASACASAAHAKNYDALKWLHENGCPWDEITFYCVALNKNLEMLKWLKERGCPWNHEACARAATSGCVETLKWLRENGCPWNASTGNLAAMLGRLEILEYLKESGYPFKKMMFNIAATNRKWEVIAWAKKNGFALDNITLELEHKCILYEEQNYVKNGY